MSTSTTKPGSSLQQMAEQWLTGRGDNPTLSVAESEMLQAAAVGKVAQCNTSDDPDPHPSLAQGWKQERVIRAELLRWLCLDVDASERIDRRGIRLYGAKLDGTLDLSFAAISFPLSLKRCRTSELQFTGAQLGSLSLTGSWTEKISADRMTVSSAMDLDEGFRARGPVYLRNASVSGNLNCIGGWFENPLKKGVENSGVAISAAGMKVGGYVLLKTKGQQKFQAQGLLNFYGAQIDGDLDCEGALIENPVQADFDNSGEALQVSTARINGQLLLRNGFCATGLVRLYATQIKGDLNCEGGKFLNPAAVYLPPSQPHLAPGVINPANKNSGIALLAAYSKIGGQALLRNGFLAQGQVGFYGAQIEGDLNCQGGRFENKAVAGIEKSGEALQASAVRVNGNVLLNRNVLLRKDFTADGIVRLYGAQIRGDLNCVSARFRNPAVAGSSNSGTALQAGICNVQGNLIFRADFDEQGRLRQGGQATGAVRFYGAQIGGDLDFTGTQIRNPVSPNAPNTGVAIEASAVRVSGNFNCGRFFEAEGAVNLHGIQIDGDVYCSGSFSNPEQKNLLEQDRKRTGRAIGADGARIKGNLSLRDGFRAYGAVSFIGAQLDGDLDCTGAYFSNPSVALNSERARIKGNVFFRDGFRADGPVRLHGTQIEGNLECSNAPFKELWAQRVSVKSKLIWRPTHTGLLRVLDFTAASSGILEDDAEGWAAKEELRLDGFVYGRILGNRQTRSRLDWLGKQRFGRKTRFSPQPYRQLAKVLKEEGDDRGARRVLYEMEMLRREEDGSRRTAGLWPTVWRWITRFWSAILRVTIGYGYYSQLALVWLILLVLAGSFLYGVGYKKGLVVPTNQAAYISFVAGGLPTSNYQPFHPLVYSIDNAFPLIHLGQSENWCPDPTRSRSALFAQGLEVFRWSQNLFGWLLATLFVAGVSGITRKD